MIELKFTSKINKEKMFQALLDSANDNPFPEEYNNVEITSDKVMLWGIFVNRPYDECRYELTDNGIKFYIEKKSYMSILFYYYFPKKFKQDVFIFFDRGIYFYSFDEFLNIKKGRVQRMMPDNINEYQCELRQEDIRQDILETVEKTKDWPSG